MAVVFGQQLPSWVPPWGPWAALAAVVVGAFVAVRELASPDGSGSTGGEDGGGDGGGDPWGGRAVDDYAARDLTKEGDCDPTAKPGVLAFRRWALERWGQREDPPSPQNIVRSCSVGNPSEHWEGRAWDLMTRDLAHGEAIAAELTASAPDGTPNELTRRAGIVNIIWNRRMWRAYPQGDAPTGTWSPYTGSNPHTDHLHISFGWPGAMGGTSLYESGVAPLAPASA